MYKLRKLINRITPPFVLSLIKRCYRFIYGSILYLNGLKIGGSSWEFKGDKKDSSTISDLEMYFDNNTEGPGIWKWRHYFDIYDKHFSKFRNKPVKILEIGIYSGGSLKMWQNYFGTECTVIGIDIEESCKVYQDEKIKIFIGDQSDREFWKNLFIEIGEVDIILDDGGHLPNQQKITLEETLSNLTPGGIYLCEDITGSFNPFHSFIFGLQRKFHSIKNSKKGNNTLIHSIPSNDFQQLVNSIHVYPFVIVIEKNISPILGFSSPKRGSQWQPFFE